MQDYRFSQGLSKHEFDNFLVSPAYYIWKKTKEWKPSRDMILGTLIHSAAIEGRIEYAVGPNVDKRTKDGKAEWQTFCEENIGKEIITPDEEKRIVCTVAKATSFLEQVKIEHVEASMYWERGGVMCKGRPDIIGTFEGRPAIIDLKTTSDFNKFDQKFWSFGYDIQAAWYRRGLMEITGKDCDFWFLVTDTEEPHFAQWVLLSGEAIEKADARIDEELERFLECSEGAHWPEPPYKRVLMSRGF
jgi:exodeoxyribonuclease VIII